MVILSSTLPQHLERYSGDTSTTLTTTIQTREMRTRVMMGPRTRVNYASRGTCVSSQKLGMRSSAGITTPAATTSRPRVA